MNLTIKINEGSKYVKKLKNFFKNKDFILSHLGKWNTIPKDFHKDIILNQDTIINNKEIDVKLIIKDESKRNQFILKNNKRLVDGRYLNKSYVEYIIEILKNYNEDKISQGFKTDNSFDYSYVDYEEFDDDYTDSQHLIDSIDIIYPNKHTTYMGSVIRNLFYNKDVNYAYNKNISRTDDYTDANEIRTGRFFITSTSTPIVVPTKYKHICNATTDIGECGNIGYFNDSHLFSSLKCTVSNGGEKGHTIQNAEKIPAWESRKLFCYQGYFEGKEDDEVLIYSLYELRQESIDCNFLYISGKTSESFVFIVAYKHELNMEVTKDKILSKTKNNNFLSDIFESLKGYYKKEHNLFVNNNNKIVSHYLILLNTAKLLFNHKYNMFVAGESGSGKTFLANKIVVPMFTMNYSYLGGSSITQPGFIGGMNTVGTIFSKKRWQPGPIATNDMVILDEATEALDKLQDKNNNYIENNIFYMLKILENGMKRSVMGAQKTKINASVVLFGNLESLKKLSYDYRDEVRKKYKLLTSGEVSFNYNLPLYKPVQYYTDVIKDDDLAEAHQWVRMNHYKNKNYITGLPTAEQGRIPIFLTIENNDKGYEPYDYTGDEDIKIYHRKQFLSEFFEIFKDIKKPPVDFIKEVHDFIVKDYFVNEPNNFVTHKNAKRNIQLFNRVSQLMADMVWINKYWNNDETTKLLEDDKTLIKYYLLYNYNVLDDDESNMKKKPFVNYLSLDNDNIDDNIHKKREKYIKEKVIEGTNTLSDEFISDDDDEYGGGVDMSHLGED